APLCARSDIKKLNRRILEKLIIPGVTPRQSRPTTSPGRLSASLTTSLVGHDVTVFFRSISQN
ncbi:hypothetical protein AB6846_00065, partial [Serratia proteamaculans]